MPLTDNPFGVVWFLLSEVVDSFRQQPTQEDYMLQPAAPATPTCDDPTHEHKESSCEKTERCQVCGNEVKTMVFRGTGVCGEAHRKAIAKVADALKQERGERDN